MHETQEYPFWLTATFLSLELRDFQKIIHVLFLPCGTRARVLIFSFLPLVIRAYLIEFVILACMALTIFSFSLDVTESGKTVGVVAGNPLRAKIFEPRIAVHPESTSDKRIRACARARGHSSSLPPPDRQGHRGEKESSSGGPLSGIQFRT